MLDYTKDYLLNKKVKIFQPINGYRASVDAVLLSSMIDSAKVKNEAKILDVGSGTGAISLCLSHRLKDKNIKITGFDIQKDLVELSNMSANDNNFADFLSYKNVDIRQKRNDDAGSYDFVITNPPYSDHDMPSTNSSKKLAHNHLDFNLSGWLNFCLKMLKPKGYFLMINRTEALNETLQAMYNKAGNIQIIPLYSKQGQEAKRVIIIAQKGSKSVTRIMPPLYIHNDDSSYTDIANSILRDGCGYFDK